MSVLSRAYQLAVVVRGQRRACSGACEIYAGRPFSGQSTALHSNNFAHQHTVPSEIFVEF